MTILYDTTPTAADAFTRGMMEPFMKRKRVGTLFSTLFGSRHAFFVDNNTSLIQIQKGNVTMAPMVVRGEPNPKVLNRSRVQARGWTEIERTFPMILRTGSFNKDQMMKRVFGEGRINSGWTKQRRARQIAAAVIADENESVVKTCEYLAAQSMTNGKQVSMLDQSIANASYDFKRHADGKQTFDVDWATKATAVPDTDLDNACDFVIDNGDSPEIALMGITKFLEWQETDEFQDRIDERNRNVFIDMNGGTVPSRYKYLEDAGAIYHFTYRTKKGRRLAIFTYEYKYNATDDDDFSSNLSYMDENTVIVFDPNARKDTCWGPSDVLEFTSEKQQVMMEWFGIDIISAGLVIPEILSGFQYQGFQWNAYRSDLRGSGVELEVQCAPIYVTTDTDSICTIKESW